MEKPKINADTKWFILSILQAIFILFAGGGMCLLRGVIPHDTAHKTGVVMVIIAALFYGVVLIYSIVRIVNDWKNFDKQWLIIMIFIFLALIFYIISTILLFEVFDRKETPKIAIGMGNTLLWVSVFGALMKYFKTKEINT